MQHAIQNHTEDTAPPTPITTHSLNYRTVLEHETPAKPRLQQSLPAPWRMLASPLSPSPKLTALENYPPPPNALDNSSPRVLLLHSLPPAGNHTHFPLHRPRVIKRILPVLGESLANSVLWGQTLTSLGLFPPL